ncbi:hypothetical protein PVAP13_1NG401238 [Panicum virgatum]|uniref:Uncharacterized protein n=1 Tax=Panicum virgatum TaxID=38727 RepID=A0A8T0X8P1_PANVG|nr:hypothetical protein PVAP13_1NG401238 [Panicum virgatum]
MGPEYGYLSFINWNGPFMMGGGGGGGGNDPHVPPLLPTLQPRLRQAPSHPPRCPAQPQVVAFRPPPPIAGTPTTTVSTTVEVPAERRDWGRVRFHRRLHLVEFRFYFVGGSSVGQLGLKPPIPGTPLEAKGKDGDGGRRESP